MNAVESVWGGVPVQAIRSRTGTVAAVELRGVDGQVELVDIHVDPRTLAVDPERDPTPLLGSSARYLPRLYAAVRAFWEATGPMRAPDPPSHGPVHPSLLGLRAVGALTYEVTLADGMPTVRVDVDALGRVRYNYPEPSAEVDLVRIGSAVRAFHQARRPAPRDGDVAPAQARSVIEASAYLELALVERKGDIDFEQEVTVRSTGSGECYVRFHAEYSGQPLDLPVLVTSGDENAPSRLLDAGQWLALLQRYIEQADELLAGLNGGEPDDAAYEAIAHELVRAQVAGAEAARFLPDDAGTVPDAAVWSALGRAQREWMPHLFDRAGIEAVATENERRIDEFIDRHGAAHLERRFGTSRRYAARSVPEAQLWAQLDTCECGGLGVGWEVVEIGSVRDGLNRMEMESACARCGRVRRLTFAVPVGTERLGPYDFAYPDDGPSNLYDAAEWWAMAQQFAQVADRMIVEATDDAWTSGRAWDEVVRYLWHAVTSLDEVLRFVPDGAAQLPAAAIWTPWGEQARQASPARFLRTSIEAERSTRRARVETFLDRHPEPELIDDGELDAGSGSGDDDGPVGEGELGTPVGSARRYPFARSIAEEQLYLTLHPCACGERRFRPPRRLDRTEDGARVSRYRGRCVACGEPREFVFRAPEVQPVVRPGEWSGVAEPSQVIDAGEWWLVARDLLTRLPAEAGSDSPPGHTGGNGVVEALGCVDEIMKFLPAGEQSVPSSAFWSVDGYAAWQENRLQFDRDGLQAGRQLLLDRLGSLADVPPDDEDGESVAAFWARVADHVAEMRRDGRFDRPPEPASARVTLPLASIAWWGGTWLEVRFARDDESTWSLGFQTEFAPDGQPRFVPQGDLYHGPPRYLEHHDRLGVALAAFWAAGAPRLEPEVLAGDAARDPVPGRRLRQITWREAGTCMLEFSGERNVLTVRVDERGEVIGVDPPVTDAAESHRLAAAVTAFVRVRDGG